jgi:hypothetical protein
MARKIEPPTHYVQHDSKAKKPTKAAVTDKKEDEGRCGREKEDLGSVAATINAEVVLGEPWMLAVCTENLNPNMVAMKPKNRG